MNFSQWLKANGYDEAAMPEAQKKHLEVAWKAEHPPKPDPAEAKPAPKPAAADGGQTMDDIIAAGARERDRCKQIESMVAKAIAEYPRRDGWAEYVGALGQAAVENKSTVKDFELTLLREGRFNAPLVTAPRAQSLTSEVVEAALAVSEKLPNVQKHYSEQALSVAAARFKRGLGLQELLVLAAEQNGYRGSIRDLKPLLEAAFQKPGFGHGGYGMRAEGPSTLAISGILSNIANKFLRVAFESVEGSWRRICTTKPVNDFKTITSYSLVGDNVYEEVPAGGEIKDGSLGQTSYTNAAKTYAKMLGLDRRDIRNDDLGALTGAGRRLGRGGALKLNGVFWAAWLDDSTFFNTDKSKNNYDDGATDSVLSLAGLTNADAIFRAQTNPQAPADPGTTPLGSVPKILLVPTALRVTGWNLLNSQYILSTGVNAAPTQGSENPWRGQFELVDSTYLGSANTNGSDTAWYLLASPDDISVIEVVFLDGVEMPTIEMGEADLDRLGVDMRGYFDFGASKQEYRGAVKLKGSA